jgi:inorganic pyrophosphatase
MDLSKISSGENPPIDVNVIIEVPMNSLPVKYEFDKKHQTIFVDRFLPTAMFYPINYGFVPSTLGGDGDPVDALVLSQYPVLVRSLIRCRPIGVLKMEDEAGQDEKILFVPINKLTRYYENINEYSDLPRIHTEGISHFFERYKELERGKWVKLLGWGNKAEAEKFIMEGIDRVKNNK